MTDSVTSINTKKLIAQTLRELMQEKPFSHITIKDITDRSGLNRKTFYYHFNDIYDLLKWIFEEESIKVINQFDLLVDYDEAVDFVMNYVKENEYLIACAYDAMGAEELKRFFFNDFLALTTNMLKMSEKKCGKKLSDNFRNFLAAFYSEAVAGMLQDWALHRNDIVKEYSEEEVRLYIDKIIEASFKAIANEN